MATPEDKAQLYDAVPATGEVAYDTLVSQLQSTGQGKLLAHFHRMRRDGELVARIDVSDGRTRLYISRGPSRPGAAG
jgi:hypothetical protein